MSLANRSCHFFTLVFGFSYIESRSRAATTGNIEIIAASQAKQVKIVVMGAEETGKTGRIIIVYFIDY